MSIPWQHIADEAQVRLIAPGEQVAHVHIPQAHTDGDLHVVSTTSAHPLFTEYRIQEQVFRVMKDFRFFQLCLPALYGMGCVDAQWDWVVRKRYIGVTYGEDVLQWPLSLAREMALMTFDLSQVPVLKFKEDVLSEHYPDRVQAYTERVASSVLSHTSRTLVLNWLKEMSVFFESKQPTLYIISNGAFFPESLIHLDESIVLNNWTEARVIALEQCVAELLMHAHKNREWCDAYMNELRVYLDCVPQWGVHMVRFSAVQRALASTDAGAADCFVAYAQEIASRYFSEAVIL